MIHCIKSKSALTSSCFVIFSLVLMVPCTMDARIPSNRKSIHNASEALIKRVLGEENAKLFLVEMIRNKDGKSFFEIDTKNSQSTGKVVLRGDSGVSIASALNHYLKRYCHSHFSWNGDQINLPKSLPSVKDNKIHIINPNKYVVYFNYCTFNYSSPW